MTETRENEAVSTDTGSAKGMKEPDENAETETRIKRAATPRGE